MSRGSPTRVAPQQLAMAVQRTCSPASIPRTRCPGFAADGIKLFLVDVLRTCVPKMGLDEVEEVLRGVTMSWRIRSNVVPQAPPHVPGFPASFRGSQLLQSFYQFRMRTSLSPISLHSAVQARGSLSLNSKSEDSMIWPLRTVPELVADRTPSTLRTKALRMVQKERGVKPSGKQD
ncbi:unnamed protein product [Cercospora beticola]|nr:unnamed protein product [Cercospora beticola]